MDARQQAEEEAGRLGYTVKLGAHLGQVARYEGHGVILVDADAPEDEQAAAIRDVLRQLAGD